MSDQPIRGEWLKLTERILPEKQRRSLGMSDSLELAEIGYEAYWLSVYGCPATITFARIHPAIKLAWMAAAEAIRDDITRESHTTTAPQTAPATPTSRETAPHGDPGDESDGGPHHGTQCTNPGAKKSALSPGDEGT